MTSISDSKASQGIDIRLALDILSQRSGEEHAAHSATLDYCGNHASEEKRELGQVIDLNPQEESLAEEQENLKAQQEELNIEREKRRSELQTTVDSMSVREQLQAVLEAQQQRVQAYQQYNKGLDSVLRTRNLSLYPQICADATAHFAVVSDTLSCLHKSLARGKEHQDLAELVQNLQKHEKDKLNFTAALHLERIRESQGGEERVLSLMRQGILSLEQKIIACMEAVTEVLEEIQCALIDK